MQGEGLTQPQFAAALGVSPTTVKRLVARAVRDAGHDALTIEGVVGGRGFCARRRVARGGEPWRFLLADGSYVTVGAPERCDGSDAAPNAADSNGTTARPDASEQIAWLRGEVERCNAALEREQLASADLRRLLLSGARDERHAESAAAPSSDAIRDAVERAAHAAGIGKKHRRDLLTRLAALLEHSA